MFPSFCPENGQAWSCAQPPEQHSKLRSSEESRNLRLRYRAERRFFVSQSPATEECIRMAQRISRPIGVTGKKVLFAFFQVNVSADGRETTEEQRAGFLGKVGSFLQLAQNPFLSFQHFCVI